MRDLTGTLLTWVDIGAPEAARLHKASKAARRVVVYAHRDADAWLARLQGERIHRGESLEIIAVDRELLSALVTRLERRMELDVSVSERTVYVSLGDQTFSGALERRQFAPVRG